MSSKRQDPGSPRLWPAIALLILLWVLRWIPGLVEEPTPAVYMLGFLGPAACALLILGWWTFASRLRWRERLLGLVGLVLILAVTAILSDESIRGFGTVGSAVPWGISAFVIGFLGARALRRRRRTAIALLAALLVFGYWASVRSEGLWGDFRTDLHWRWEKAPEERILSDLEQRTGSAAGEAPGPEPLAAAEWPGFRGPGRDGVVPGVALAEDWTVDPPRELWRIRVGPGWSSFAVAAVRPSGVRPPGRWLFTQEQRGDNEAVVSYDAETGAELWATEYRSRFWESMGGVGPRATPTLSDGRLFTLGAEGLLHRLEPATGDVVWQADLRSDAGREPPTWGFASSPLVVDSRVIVHAGGDGDRGILAYDAESGELVWGTPAGGHSYSSPQLSTVAGALSVPVVTDAGLTLVDPAGGAVLWQYEWPFENYRILQPLLVSDTSLLISTGFGVGTRRLDLRREDGRLTARERWTSRAMKPDFNDYVAHQGYLYGFDVSIFACVDLETGERRWKRGRYGHGQVLLLPDADQLLVIAESGELVLLRADPEELNELARIEVFDGKTWNHPVLVGDRLYLRNAEEAVGLAVPVG
jgi:outer membrane protein assembly factor BamB